MGTSTEDLPALALASSRVTWTVLWLLLAIGCRTFDAGGPPVASVGPAWLERVVRVPLYADEPLYFVAGNAGSNRRQVDRVVRLPEPTEELTSVTLELRLACPDEDCDSWDRKGYLGILQEPDQTAYEREAAVGLPDSEGASVLEVLRFITPFGVGGQWTADVTRLVPLLHGERAFRLFIDTWVGPGDPEGAGWLVDATLHYRYRASEAETATPIAVHRVWAVQEVGYGDPALAIADQIASRRLRIPGGAGRVEIQAFITGHGQGNADNCAEFCAREHTLWVGNTPFRRTVWRDNCDVNPLVGQAGSWQYPRAGWCPGSLVEPWVMDVTAALTDGDDIEITYEVESDVNTCRPDAPICEGCTLGTSCAYDDGRHTPPLYLVSAVLIVYP